MKKVIIPALSSVVGAVAGGITVAKLSKDEQNRLKSLADKHLVLMKLFNQWMLTKQEGKSVIDYFHQKGIKTIAIYGMSYVGERLYDELKNTDIQVKYGIDKNADAIYSDLEIVLPKDSLQEVDAIVVTSVYFYAEIEEMLAQKTDSLILSLEDILYEL